jgi:hypothetical protein
MDRFFGSNSARLQAGIFNDGRKAGNFCQVFLVLWRRSNRGQASEYHIHVPFTMSKRQGMRSLVGLKTRRLFFLLDLETLGPECSCLCLTPKRSKPLLLFLYRRFAAPLSPGACPALPKSVSKTPSFQKKPEPAAKSGLDSGVITTAVSGSEMVLLPPRQSREALQPP